MQKKTVENTFPHDTFRPYQRETIENIIESFEKGKRLVILEAPVGYGKSATNIGVANYLAEEHSCRTFYTTPQVKLIDQLEKDYCPDGLAIDGHEGNIMSLKGRRNYICQETGERSDECKLRRKTDGCRSHNCTYWQQKSGCMNSDTTILTFAMLIIDSMLQRKNPIASFEDRDLLIVDEAHSLEEQTASLFCGFAISPYNIPMPVWSEMGKTMPKEKNSDISRYMEWIKELKDKAYEYLDENAEEMDRDNIDKTYRLLYKVRDMISDVYDGRRWVVDVEQITYKGRSLVRPKFKPVKIDKFLEEKVWNRGDYIIISSATIPFRDNPRRWLERLGLPNTPFEYIKVPMIFDKSNRPIITSYMGGKMTSKLEDVHWSDNVDTVKKIIEMHGDDKGVIHTQSYKRAKKLYKSLPKGKVHLHSNSPKKRSSNPIEDWIKSGKDVLLSPSIKEGVDLIGDLCRYQILFKIPFPSIGDSRVKYLLEKENDWDWYYNETGKDVVQSYGRAIRSEEDEAKFYIIDGSFESLKRKYSFPEWFTEAIGLENFNRYHSQAYGTT